MYANEKKLKIRVQAIISENVDCILMKYGCFNSPHIFTSMLTALHVNNRMHQAHFDFYIWTWTYKIDYIETWIIYMLIKNCI